MVTTNLYEKLSVALIEANEIWIAVALLNDEGFDLLAKMFPSDANLNFLVGINLPTPVSVLHTMLRMQQDHQLRAKICNPSKGIFHPKLYLTRRHEEYRAFIGSANLTLGGLINNIELTVEIHDQAACTQLLEWFNMEFEKAYPLSEENIEIYRKASENILDRGTDNNRIEVKLKKQDGSSFDDIDFSHRYFKKKHHLAFHKSLWRDDSPIANRQRKEAETRFLELHETIFPNFSVSGLDNLHPNRKNHIVSMHHHFQGRPKQRLNAMWLSYGKSEQEIKKYNELFPKDRYNSDKVDQQSFINHARLQIRIELAEIGIWILFGKENGGSIFDRDHFRKQMQQESYKKQFFQLVKTLPHPYWVEVNNEVQYVEDFLDPDALYQFTRKDNADHYFIIGRDYAITDDEMSETRLPKTVLEEFARLNPIYKKMRHYL